MIDKFTGDYRFLSNFYPVRSGIRYCGILFPSVEHAYQAAKSHDVSYQNSLVNLTAGEAKRAGSTVELRHDWELVKLDIMRALVHQKFKLGTYLAGELIATHPHTLIESNTWRDQYWGVYNGAGENHLGMILMNVRHNLINIERAI